MGGSEDRRSDRSTGNEGTTLKAISLRQTGLTLVELMVAVTLSLVLLAGVLVIFQSNKTTYRLQGGLSTLQESGRYALNQIVDDLKMAGYGGCVSPHVDRTIALAATPSGADAFLDDLVSSGILVSGVNDDQTKPGPFGDNNIVVKDDTDTLEIIGPLNGAVAPVNAAASNAAGGVIDVQGHDLGFRAVGGGRNYLVIADCQKGVLFCSTALNETTTGSPSVEITAVTHGSGSGSCTNVAGGKLGDEVFAEDAYVMQMDSHTYFIGQTGRTYPQGGTLHALFRFDGDGNAEELIEGVENLQVRYGLDTDGDGSVDAYVDASATTEWDSVATVHIWLFVNSVTQASEVVAPYQAFAPNTAAHPPADRRLQQEFTAQVAVRNAVIARLE
jgi:type IV pilus assembly protein PilW